VVRTGFGTAKGIIAMPLKLKLASPHFRSKEGKRALET
jgi:hypothetical protein